MQCHFKDLKVLFTYKSNFHSRILWVLGCLIYRSHVKWLPFKGVFWIKPHYFLWIIYFRYKFREKSPYIRQYARKIMRFYPITPSIGSHFTWDLYIRYSQTHRILLWKFDFYVNNPFKALRPPPLELNGSRNFAIGKKVFFLIGAAIKASLIKTNKYI